MQPSIPRIRRALVAWYRREKRDLPWRRTRDPYAIWVSEVMLQQTQAGTVKPRYERWLGRFPTIESLAHARPGDVMTEWAGLGYYARARNLQDAAREVVARYGGRLPCSAAQLRSLPGIGRYTAGAIASIAFEQPEPVLDGNVIRVLSRLFCVGGAPHRAATSRRLWALAAELVAGGSPSEVNQALMELGATVCRPRQPECPHCPLGARCLGARRGQAGSYPAASPRPRVRALDRVTVVVERRGKLLLVERPPRGLWGGLLEFPSDEPRRGETHDQTVRRLLGPLRATDLAPILRFEHQLSHRRIRFHTYHARAASGRVRLAGYARFHWLTPRAALALGISKATRRQLAAVYKDNA